MNLLEEAHFNPFLDASFRGIIIWLLVCQGSEDFCCVLILLFKSYGLYSKKSLFSQLIHCLECMYVSCLLI